MKNYDEISEKLKENLDHKRYIHTLGVAYTAAAMAMRYEYDTDRALLAGLLHDCAKCIPNDEKFRLCSEGGIILSEVEQRNTALIHAKLGVYIAERDYGVTDREILDAIRTHTTGEPDMTLLQKIIYTADLIEPGRDAQMIPHLPLFRRVAFEDLDECIYIVTKHQLEYLEGESGKEVDPETRRTYDYYSMIHAETFQAGPAVLRS